MAKYKTLAEAIAAKDRGELPDDAVFKVDNDCAWLECRQGEGDERVGVDLFIGGDPGRDLIFEALEALGFKVTGV